jgi:hypothetical protein
MRSHSGTGTASTGNCAPIARCNAATACSESVIARAQPASATRQSLRGLPPHGSSGMRSNSHAITGTTGQRRTSGRFCGAVNAMSTHCCPCALKRSNSASASAAGSSTTVTAPRRSKATRNSFSRK